MTAGSDPARRQPVPLVDAASVVLLREHAGRVETLLTRRHAEMAFGGLWVFAGGKVDDGDRRVAMADHFRPAPMRRHDAPDSWLGIDEAGAFYIAAARELAEEVGVRLDGGVTALVYFAHWITPPDLPRRFDTRFFLAAAPVDFIVGHAYGEVAEFRWITPRDALAARERDELPTAPVTAFTIAEVADTVDRHGSLAAMLAAERGRDVLPIMPKRDPEADLKAAVLPWHPRYHEVQPPGIHPDIAIPAYYRARPDYWSLPAIMTKKR
jgi:8-oxo-dGTP pyrophosphatase MutT (NUDIX family)